MGAQHTGPASHDHVQHSIHFGAAQAAPTQTNISGTRLVAPSFPSNTPPTSQGFEEGARVLQSQAGAAATPHTLVTAPATLEALPHGEVSVEAALTLGLYTPAWTRSIPCWIHSPPLLTIVTTGWREPRLKPRRISTLTSLTSRLRLRASTQRLSPWEGLSP